MKPEELKSYLESAVAEFKAALEAQAEEIKSRGATTDETAKRIAELEARIEEIKSELAEVLKGPQRPSYGQPHEAPKNIGQMFTESEQYKHMIQSKALASAPVELKSLWTKDTLTTDDASTGNLSQPLRYPTILEPNKQDLRLRDLIPVIPTSEGTVEFVRTTGFVPVVTALDGAVVTTAATAVLVSVAGIATGSVIRVAADTRTVVAVDRATRTITANANWSAAHADGTRVTASRVAPTLEGQTKPTGDLAFTLESESVKTVAASVDISRQALADANQLQAYINVQLTYELAFAEEYQFMYGDGTSPNLRGIMNEVDIQTYNWSSGPSNTDTKIDAIRRAMTLATLARYPVSGLVVHPTDWEDIELQKGSDNHYVWIVITEGGVQRFFRVPVVVSEAINSGESLVGAFGLGATIWDREQSNIRISEHHEDYFKRNLAVVLGEERVALTTHRPEAFVKVTFDNAPI